MHKTYQSVDYIKQTTIHDKQHAKMATLYNSSLNHVLSPQKKQSPFEKQSISERLDSIKNMGNKQDKKIEKDAYF